MAGRPKKGEISPERQDKRDRAEADLASFIELVHPKRMLGNIHRDVIKWWTASNSKSHQLLLLPRDHMKSALIAYRAAWEVVKNPSIRILYISSTSNLATKQLKFIKDILASDTVRSYWPDLVLKEEAKREKWTEREISVDHPQRKEDAIRDPTIFTAGLTTNIVGMHCDIEILDDVVVAGNAYTEEGREKVREQYGYLSSIGGANSRVWVVGTRYHPNDLYSDLVSMEVDYYDEFGNKTNSEPLYECMERQVERAGDGTGEFLWPRTKTSDGRWYGFNAEVLAKKRSEYINKLHFRAQYYNDPHDIDSSPIQRNLFQYYDQSFLSKQGPHWYYKRERLNVVAAVDFAYSLGAKSDFTAIVVIGVDGQNNYYILEIDRFKADRPSEYYPRILKLYEKWGFRKIRAEVTAAQVVIVNDLKENYIRKFGLALAIEEHRPTRWIGSKEERMLATLEPRYANRQIWHYKGGNIQILEEELLFANPAHDDVKDALTSAIDFAVAPVNSFRQGSTLQNTNINFHSRFGGVS